MKYAPLGLFVLALAVRWLAVTVMRFDGLYGQDAFAYYNCAVDLAHMRACQGFYWPLGYPALAAPLLWLTPLGAQLASLVAGAAVAPLVYWWVSELRPVAGADATGAVRNPLTETAMPLAAGLVTALCGGLLASSIEVMSDAAGLFWATLAACLLTRWARTRTSLWLLTAAAALSVAVVTRWIFGGLAVPFGAFIAMVLYRRQTSVWPVLFALVLFLAILLPQLYVNADSGAPLLKHGWVVNWSPWNAFHRSFDNPDGHFDYRWPPLLYYAQPFAHPAFLFPLLTPFVLVGAWQLRRSPELIPVGGWIVALYLYLVGVPYENSRFGLALFAPIAVLTSVGLFPQVTAWRCSLLAVSLALAMPFTWLALANFEANFIAQTAAIRYLQSRATPGATVVSFELSISLQHYTRFEVVDLYAQSPESLRPKVCGGQPTYLYVERARLDSQWVGKTPLQNVQWLQDKIGLQELGRQSSWTLYAVRPCAA